MLILELRLEKRREHIIIYVRFESIYLLNVRQQVEIKNKLKKKIIYLFVKKVKQIV